MLSGLVAATPGKDPVLHWEQVNTSRLRDSFETGLVFTPAKP